ncbi:hypothetical protein PG991_006095 [Apiospora marii]|uniref:Uncharacterized protein n=1 Tax=Apiospora marii TaxID=335849 RepID=A0ABR1SCW2_9PEZI
MTVRTRKSILTATRQAAKQGRRLKLIEGEAALPPSFSGFAAFLRSGCFEMAVAALQPGWGSSTSPPPQATRKLPHPNFIVMEPMPDPASLEISSSTYNRTAALPLMVWRTIGRRGRGADCRLAPSRHASNA